MLPCLSLTPPPLQIKGVLSLPPNPLVPWLCSYSHKYSCSQRHFRMQMLSKRSYKSISDYSIKILFQKQEWTSSGPKLWHNHISLHQNIRRVANILPLSNKNPHRHSIKGFRILGSFALKNTFKTDTSSSDNTVW